MDSSPSINSRERRTNGVQLCANLEDGAGLELFDSLVSSAARQSPLPSALRQSASGSRVVTFPAELERKSSIAAGRWNKVAAVLSMFGPQAAATHEGLDGDHFSKLRFQQLHGSWMMLALRIYHCWCFMFAGIICSVVGINYILELFVDALSVSADSGQLLGIIDATAVLHATTEGLLWSFVFAGLMQRAIWLSLDAYQVDSFLEYRRTLCCEGAGPGTFTKQRVLVTVAREQDLLRLQSALCQDGKLEIDLQLAGTVLFIGTQLLAVEAMAGKMIRDDVRSLPLPSKLVFRTASRQVSLSTSAGWRSRTWALSDVGWQCIIYASLDILPIIFPAPEGPLFPWRVIMGSALSACVHTCVYYVWSVIMDYKLKFASLWHLSLEGADAYVLPKAGFQGSQASTRWSLVKTLTSKRTSEREEKVFGARARELEERFYESGQEQIAAESLNVCLRLADLFVLTSRLASGRRLLLGLSSCFMLLALVLLTTTQLGVSAFLSAVASAGLISPVLLPLVRLRDLNEEKGLGFWHSWFRFHCGVGLFTVVLGVLYFTNLGMLLLYAGFVVHDSFIESLLGVAFLAYAAALVLTQIYYPGMLWTLALLWACLVISMSIGPDYYRYGITGIGTGVALLFLTQAGLSRDTRSRFSSYFFLLFNLVLIINLGIMSFLASRRMDGFSFGRKDFSFCEEGDLVCKDFVFPVWGSRRPYEFCSMAWPMGPNKSAQQLLEPTIWNRGPSLRRPATVSERCQDTSLGIVDFGEMANLAYHLPNIARVNTTMERYFPGWHLVAFQTYDVHAGKLNTFIHLQRGSTNVISVRGTWSVIEALQDLTVWMPTVMLQMAAVVFPTVLEIKYVMRVMAKIGYTKGRTVFKDILVYTKELLERLDEDERRYVYITGHSLGGGLATMVGGILGVTAITFSPPGIGATAEILEPAPTNSELRHHIVSVSPDTDFVRHVDSEEGLWLPIDCKGHMGFACHSLDITMCELLASCGDGGGRGISRGYVRSCGACSAGGHALDAANVACHAADAQGAAAYFQSLSATRDMSPRRSPSYDGSRKLFHGQYMPE